MFGIDAGDYVRIGDSDLTWFVKAIHPADSSAQGPLAHLVSGQTERSRYEPVVHLRLYRKQEFDA